MRIFQQPARKWLGTSAIVLLNTALLIGCVFLGYSAYLAFRYRAGIDLQVTGDWPLQGDDEIGFVAARNASTVRTHTKQGNRYHLFTDARGARVNAPGEQTPDRVSILTVGGSFAWGHGIENDETYTQLLGRQLQVPVANLAYGSYGTVQSLQLLERNADLQPQLITYAFIEDHLRRNLSPCAPSYTPFCLPVSYVAFDAGGKPYLHRPVSRYSPAPGKRLFQALSSERFDLWDIRWGAKVALAQLQKRFILNTRDGEATRRRSMAWLMRRMTQAARKIGARLVVVYIPYLHSRIAKPPPEALAGALTADVLFLDLAPAITAHYADAGNPPLGLSDGHPNVRAHALIARELRALLDQAQPGLQ